jgi:endosialidase-like protein
MGGGGMGGGLGMSDVRAKHDVALLGVLENGLGFYRFSYNGSDRAYVGVMAQEVQSVMPAAVVLGDDGYLRVNYGMLGLRMQTFEDWLADGARLPATGLH